MKNLKRDAVTSVKILAALCVIILVPGCSITGTPEPPLKPVLEIHPVEEQPMYVLPASAIGEFEGAEIFFVEDAVYIIEEGGMYMGPNATQNYLLYIKRLEDYFE